MRKRFWDFVNRGAKQKSKYDVFLWIFSNDVDDVWARFGKETTCTWIQDDDGVGDDDDDG